MDAATRELLEAIRDALALPPGVQRQDATDSVYAVLSVLLSEDALVIIAAEARWLRRELAAVAELIYP